MQTLSNHHPPAALTAFLRQHTALLFILLAALTLRLTAFSLGPATSMHRALVLDSPRYIELSVNLADRGLFAKSPEDPGAIYGPIQQLRDQRGELELPSAPNLYPEIMRTPGYPAFLAAARILHMSLLDALLIQCLLSAASIVLVYLLAIQLLNSKTPALIAAAIVALHPADVLSPSSILSETLFTFLILAAFVLTIMAQKATRKPRLWREPKTTNSSHPPGFHTEPSTPHPLPRTILFALFAGLLIGLAALVRPIAVAIAPALAVWLGLANRNARAAFTAATLAAASMLPIGLWAARNAAVGFGPRLSYVDSLQAFSKTAAAIRMSIENKRRYPEDWLAVYHDSFNQLRRQIRPDETVFAAMDRLAWQTIRDHPVVYTSIVADNALKFVADHSLPDLYRLLDAPYHPSGIRDILLGKPANHDQTIDLLALSLAAAWTAINLLLAALALAGAARLARYRRWPELLFLSGVFLYFLLTTQAHGLERMRIPILGIQAVTVAAFLTNRSKLLISMTIKQTTQPSTAIAPQAPTTPIPNSTKLFNRRSRTSRNAA